MSASGPVHVARRDAVGVIEIDNPPVNALAQPVRAALLAAIEALDADAAVRAILVHGRGRHFIAGADVREFDAPPRAPLLNDVLLRLEACGKPVVAALHGTTLGGGAELALASHYRCASRDLSFGLPEIRLGLLPGSGGTVRLPRLIGVERALELMQRGTPLDFSAANALGLVDREIEGEVLEAALAWARELVAQRAPVRRLRERAIPAAPGADFFAGRREALSAAERRVPAQRALIEALEAAARAPFAEALRRTRELFETCRVSPESRALRHLFFAERAAGGPDGAAPRAVARIGIVGAGTMGSGIAISAATAGLEATLVDAQPQALEAARARIDATLAESVRKGRLHKAEGAAAAARVRYAADLESLAAADLVIEAVFEKLEVKCKVFARLGAVCRADAVLATNTSALDVDAIAAASGRAGDVVGMHFFSPAHVMRLVEVVRGRDSAPAALATARAVSRRMGKIPVVVGNAFGFVGNRMLYAYGREKELLMLEGATPAAVDRALEDFGMAMGPNAVGDLAGLDVGYHARRAWASRPDDPRFYRVSDLLVERGRLGQKTGAGFYRYAPGARRGTPDPEVDALIRDEARRLGIEARAVGADEIVERCVLALINEGARLIDAGIAASAADVDVIWCNGYGFPRERGGPMFHGEQLGPRHVLARLAHYARQCGARYWTPAAWLERAAHEAGDPGSEPGLPEQGRRM